MFKRLFWLLVGIGFGFGLAFWFMRFVKETIERYSPERVGSDLAGAVKQLGADLRAAADEFRAGMREAEDDIRAQLEGRAPIIDLDEVEELPDPRRSGRS